MLQHASMFQSDLKNQPLISNHLDVDLHPSSHQGGKSSLPQAFPSGRSVVRFLYLPLVQLFTHSESFSSKPFQLQEWAGNSEWQILQQLQTLDQSVRKCLWMECFKGIEGEGFRSQASKRLQSYIILRGFWILDVSISCQPCHFSFQITAKLPGSQARAIVTPSWWVAFPGIVCPIPLSFELREIESIPFRTTTCSSINLGRLNVSSI